MPAMVQRCRLVLRHGLSGPMDPLDAMAVLAAVAVLAAMAETEMSKRTGHTRQETHGQQLPQPHPR